MARRGQSSATEELVGACSTLIHQLVPQLGPPEADARAERLLQLCLRIVGSRMAGGAGPGGRTRPSG